MMNILMKIYEKLTGQTFHQVTPLQIVIFHLIFSQHRSRGIILFFTSKLNFIEGNIENNRKEEALGTRLTFTSKYGRLQHLQFLKQIEVIHKH